LQWTGLLLITIVGITGLDGSSGRSLALPCDLHELFGALLISFVALRFHMAVRRETPPCPAQISLQTRLLSRQVYLVLALLALAQQLKASPRGELRDYFVYALIALVLMRVQAVLCWERERRRSRAMR